METSEAAISLQETQANLCGWVEDPDILTRTLGEQ